MIVIPSRAGRSDPLHARDVLPWDHAAAESYGSVRAEMAGRGKVLAPLDVLIATHALSVGAVLVTSDKAFAQFPGLTVEDWAR